MRTILAHRFDYPPYMIFHDTTLDQLVLEMPRNQNELLKIHGIGPKLCQQFGHVLLQVIRQYRATTSTIPFATAFNDTDNNDDDDPVQVVQTLSVEELIQQRFAQAQESGQVISI